MSNSNSHEGLVVAGFDPPSQRNLGYGVLRVEGGVARLVESGVCSLPDGDAARLLAIQSFVVDLFEKWDIDVMCFERAIGRGEADVRERIGENTGVIKLVGASFGAELQGLHPQTNAKTWTGYGGGKDKGGRTIKTRMKQMSRDVFFPKRSFKSIASDENGKENFEHQADGIGLAACYLLKHGIPVSGDGMGVLPMKVVEEDEE